MMRILIASCVIPNVLRATGADAYSSADIYLRSRKELVACAPLVHSDQSVREWVRQKLIPAGSVTVASVDGVVIGFVAMSRGNECSWMDRSEERRVGEERGGGGVRGGLAGWGGRGPVR